MSYHIADLIKKLEKPDPDDDFPAATRGTLAHLRIMESEGPLEMMQAIHANIAAGVAALMVIAPTPKEGMLLYTELALKVMKEIQATAAYVATEGTPK